MPVQFVSCYLPSNSCISDELLPILSKPCMWRPCHDFVELTPPQAVIPSCLGHNDSTCQIMVTHYYRTTHQKYQRRFTHLLERKFQLIKLRKSEKVGLQLTVENIRKKHVMIIYIYKDKMQPTQRREYAEIDVGTNKRRVVRCNIKHVSFVVDMDNGYIDSKDTNLKPYCRKARRAS